MNPAPTKIQLHLALDVGDIVRSIGFYTDLLGRKPDKVRPGYARFQLPEPGLVLTLNTVPKPGSESRVSHFGMRLPDRAGFEAWCERMREAGYELREENRVLCCHSIQNKVWVSDPDGNEWELYELLDDAPRASAAVGTCQSTEPATQGAATNGSPRSSSGCC